MIKQWLEEKYGFNNLEKQGLTIKTTLDWELQKDTEKMVSTEVNKIAKLNITNGAALVVGVKDGDACIDVLKKHGITTLKKYQNY